MSLLPSLVRSRPFGSKTIPLFVLAGLLAPFAACSAPTQTPPAPAPASNIESTQLDAESAWFRDVAFSTLVADSEIVAVGAARTDTADGGLPGGDALTDEQARAAYTAVTWRILEAIHGEAPSACIVTPVWLNLRDEGDPAEPMPVAVEHLKRGGRGVAFYKSHVASDRAYSQWVVAEAQARAATTGEACVAMDIVLYYNEAADGRLTHGTDARSRAELVQRLEETYDLMAE